MYTVMEFSKNKELLEHVENSEDLKCKIVSTTNPNAANTHNSSSLT